ncbi:MAG TPA: type VI secretion system contractile sheath small subunit [Fibrobacteria bacterium]|jgi:type VI secretion system protein ImpB|nr:type VI secretion system contractile sheath small subunit [Fibrobacteria bacterium]
MAGTSFQNEIPPARVNIQLNVDKGGAQKKVELPLKLLVLGDFTQRKDDTRVSEREKINIDKNNFDQVLESLDLGVKTVVPNKVKNDGSDLAVDLKIKNMKSFEPSEIVKQVPELSKLMAARNLIRDLGSNLLDNREFRKRMEGILKDKSAMEGILAELDKVAPEKKEG